MANYNEENGVVGTESGDLSEVMDTNVSGGTLEFVKDNAAASAVVALAIIGAYNIGKRIVFAVKRKISEKNPAKPTLKERLKRKAGKKKEETPEKEAE